jgi:hypothetical protein
MGQATLIVDQLRHALAGHRHDKDQAEYKAWKDSEEIHTKFELRSFTPFGLERTAVGTN